MNPVERGLRRFDRAQQRHTQRPRLSSEWQVTVYAAEINVVLARHLWPRSIIQPPLTEADRSSMALQALQNQRREEQNVTVSFNDRPRRERADPQTPRTPAQISPPADPAGPALHGS
jgi:hypothetical protein